MKYKVEKDIVLEVDERKKKFFANVEYDWNIFIKIYKDKFIKVQKDKTVNKIIIDCNGTMGNKLVMLWDINSMIRVQGEGE